MAAGASRVFTTPGYKGLGQESSFHRAQRESASCLLCFFLRTAAAAPGILSTFPAWEDCCPTQPGRQPWQLFEGKGILIFAALSSLIITLLPRETNAFLPRPPWDDVHSPGGEQRHGSVMGDCCHPSAAGALGWIFSENTYCSSDTYREQTLLHFRRLSWERKSIAFPVNVSWDWK